MWLLCVVVRSVVFCTFAGAGIVQRCGPELAWRIEIGTRVKRIGRSSFELEQCLFFAETEDVIAVYNTVVVWFDFGAQTSMRVPETIRERIREYEAVPPEE